MKKVFTIVLLVASSQFLLMAQPVDIPNAQPGKCYAKCLTPDQFETYTERVLVRPASKKITIVPAKTKTTTERVMSREASTKLIATEAEFETKTERVMVKAASKRIVTTPAVYEEMTETYVMKEGYNRIEKIPARYETKTESVQIRPVGSKWVKKKADRNCLSADPEDCMVWCLVETPAEYKTVTSKVRMTCPAGYTDNGEDCTKSIAIAPVMGSRKVSKLKTPARSAEIEIPAEYKDVQVRVLKSAAGTREISIPAEYKEITKTVLDSPESTTEVTVPEEYTTVTKTRLVKAGGMTEWKEVVCDNMMTSELIRSVQIALRNAGFDPGPIDNIMGSLTKAALVKYQKAKGLAIGNLDMDTMKSLGVKY